MGWNEMVIEQFLEGRERVADTFDRDSMLLLGTTGARSGQPRVSPLVYLADGDRLVVVASAAGADHHPAWYHNLLANPQVQVQRWAQGQLRTYDARAEVAGPDERERLWQVLTQRSPGFAGYQEKTDRTIPVVLLHPPVHP